LRKAGPKDGFSLPFCSLPLSLSLSQSHIGYPQLSVVGKDVHTKWNKVLKTRGKHTLQKEKVTRPRWLTPVILAIQEAKSRRTVVQSQPHQQIVQETQK
jgi:hypothetical protein